VDGDAASHTWAVVEVDTRGLVFDGGTRSFDLTVGESDALPRTITVTLKIETRKTGAAVFTVTRDAEGVETLERLDTGGGSFATFQAALEGVDVNAQPNTEYLLRVEQDNRSLPRFLLTFNNAENVTLRLRGDQDGPWTLQRADNTVVSYNVDSAAWSTSPSASLYSWTGFFSIGPVYGTTVGVVASKKTFILGSNITVEGLGNKVYQTGAYSRSAFYVCPNATLVLEPGFVLRDWYTVTDSYDLCPIHVISASAANRNPTKHGKLRIEGGSFINNTFNTNQRLIYVGGGGEEALEYGAFYKTASTAANPIVFSGNTNDKIFFYRTSKINSTYDLAVNTGELSIPKPEAN
jgi:hypothetical protein